MSDRISLSDGEKGRGLKMSIREHKEDLRNHRLSIPMHSSLMWMKLDSGHLPDWAGAASLNEDFTKTQRKIVEVALYNCSRGL